MILRNPSYWRDFLFLICSFILFLPASSLFSQGISGIIRDQASRQPVTGVKVSIIRADSIIANLSSDMNGRFNFSSAEAGRIQLSFTAEGFKPLLSETVALDGYSTYQLEYRLERNPIELESVTVVSYSVTEPGVQRITKEDLEVVAGNFDDPVRVAHSKPGIILLNDQANHFSSRGQSPVFNNWYLEGLQIVNPNHTSNAGLLYDRPTQFGGGVNMFSAQVLGSTEIYTGINPFSIRRTGGASINMNLHETVKPEWRAKAGFIGFELGGGSAIGKESILDFNLRYSFTGLLSNMGVDFGGEKIGFYDGVISFLQRGTNHTFKLFTWAGRSTNEFDKVENESEREAYKDFFNIDYGNNILGAGARYNVAMSSSVYFRSGFSYSTNTTTYSSNGDFEPPTGDVELDQQLSILSSFLDFTIRHSAKFHSLAGVQFSRRTYSEEDYQFLPFPAETFIRPFLQTSFAFAPGLRAEIGGELYWSIQYEDIIPGYRASLKWNLTEKDLVFGGFNHVAGEPMRFTNDINANIHSLSDNYEIGWEHNARRQSFGFNVYYQQLERSLVHFTPAPSVFVADYPFPIINPNYSGSSLDATSKHIGMEGKWSLSNARGWRLELNQSIFKSERGLQDSIVLPGRYDSRFSSHVLIAKEVFNKKKEKNRIWNFSIRGLLHGGLLEPAIDETSSDIFNTTVFQSPGLFDNRLPVFKRIDAGISRTIANTNVRWRYSLDIQNLLGFTNIAYHYYDPFLHSIESQNQLGIIPVFAIQASW